MLSPAAGRFASVWAGAWLATSCCFADPRADDAAACKAYARATCSRLERCAPATIEQTYGSVNNCTDELSDTCVDSLAQPDAIASAVGVRGCGALMKRVSCGELLNNNLPAGCQAPSGRRSDGVECATDAQCASARCAKRQNDDRGVCRERAPRGGICSRQGDCQPRLVCAENERCVALEKEGAACNDDRPCSYPLACVEQHCTDCSDDQCNPLSAERVHEGCTSYADALCARLTSCSPALVARVYGDERLCRERTRDACERSAPAPDTASTGRGIGFCGAALETVACEDLLNHNLPEACRLLKGVRANGSACGADAQCASTRCAREMNQNCGICATVADADEPCTGESDCQIGLVCSPSRTCLRPLTEQQSCSADRPCAYPWVCTSGTCRATLRAGARCDPAADGCNLFVGEICGPVSLVCEPLLYASEGAPCGYLDGGWTVCRQGAVCGGTSPASRCVRAASEGDSCAAPMPGCLSPARCVEGVCSLTDASECS